MVWLTVLPTALAIGIAAGRWFLRGQMGLHYLPWNLFLAWVPFGVAVVVEWRRRNGHVGGWPFWLLLVTWLAFLPNAPYIVTDFIHIIGRRGMVFWFDLAHLMAFALAGAIAGIHSMCLMHVTLRERFGSTAAQWALLAAATLSGLGIYVGRVLRWNSWDLLLRPQFIARRTAHLALNPWDNRYALALSLLFGLIFAVMYVVMANTHDAGQRRG
jgi:uncharacterized membrane protein